MIEKGSIFVSDGNIVFVIEGIEVLLEYWVVDVFGKVIFLGFIGVLMLLGFVEVFFLFGVVDVSIEILFIIKIGVVFDVSYGINLDFLLFEIIWLEGMIVVVIGMMGGYFLFNG